MTRPVWTWRPNWNTPVVERLIWLTDVQTARDGTEERHRLRQIPRRTMQFAAHAEGHHAQRLDALLWGKQLDEWLMPLWWDASRLDAELAAGDRSVSAPTTDRDFRAGSDSWVVLLDPKTHDYHASAVDTLADGSMGLATGPSEAWPAGSLIYPARIVRLRPGQSVTHETAGVAGTPVAAEVIDTQAATSSSDADGDGSSSMLDGLAVFDRKPNWSSSLDAEFQRLMTRIDNEVGTWSVLDHAGRPFVARSQGFLFKDRAEMWSFRGWLEHAAGKYQAFWHPTDRLDLTLTRDVADTDTTIYVKNVGYAANYNSQRGRDHIAISAGGTTIYREITGATTVDADEEALALGTSITGSWSASSTKVSWLEQVRQAADAIEIQHVSAEVSQLAIPYRTLRP